MTTPSECGRLIALGNLLHATDVLHTYIFQNRLPPKTPAGMLTFLLHALGFFVPKRVLRMGYKSIGNEGYFENSHVILRKGNTQVEIYLPLSEAAQPTA